MPRLAAVPAAAELTSRSHRWSQKCVHNLRPSAKVEARHPRWRSKMIFILFAVAIAALFFVGSLIALRLGRHLGLRHRKRNGTDGNAGLATVEGAIFGLMGLLLLS